MLAFWKVWFGLVLSFEPGPLNAQGGRVVPGNHERIELL